MARKRGRMPDKLQAWVEARRRYRLSHAQVQMARELGLNPKKLGKLANSDQESWKVPLPAYIEELYLKRFGRSAPERVVSMAERGRELEQKRQERKRRKVALPERGEERVAWYRREQWDQLRQASVDSDKLEETYDEWVEGAERRIRHLATQGVAVQRIEVDIEELVSWCWKQGMLVNAEARGKFAADVLRKRTAVEARDSIRTEPGSGTGREQHGPSASQDIQPRTPVGPLERKMWQRVNAPYEPPGLGQWRRLYDLAAEVKKLAPWEWMFESQVFGVEEPESGELGFVSVMGNLGEHLAIAVYPGVKALYAFWDLAMGDAEERLETIMEVPQTQLSFEERGLLEREDRAVVKQLSLGGRFRGAMGWPLFRSYRPGYAPWFIEADEARFLACVLEQLLVVAPRIRAGEDALVMTAEGQLLVRTPERRSKEWVWKDQIRDVVEPEAEYVPITVPGDLMAQIRNLPSTDGVLEVAAFVTGARIQANRRDRPELPYTLLAADSRSGFVLGAEVLVADPDLNGMWGQVPGKVLEMVAKAGMSPATFRVDSPRLARILELVCSELDLALEVVGNLPAVAAARAGMEEWMEKR